MHLRNSIAGRSINPWYMQDETAELKLLRRHKSVISDVERYTRLKYDPLKGCESEQDGYLLLSRYMAKIDMNRRCTSCNTLPEFKKCLECIDVGLCMICTDRGEEPKDHVASHRMVELR